MIELHLPAGLGERLREACEREYPREACGLLLGQGDGSRRVLFVVPARNLEPRGDRFVLDPADFIRADARAREAGIEIVGVFHSHPDRAADPSAEDVAAAQPGWSHVILSVTGDGRAGRMAGVGSWRLAEDADGRRLVPEPIRGA